MIHEWIVTKALESNFQTTGSAWLFTLEVQTRHGSRTVEGLCGFGPDDCKGGVEQMFRLADRGKIGEDDFHRLFKDRTPDCSFWTPDRQRQLFIEFKGRTRPSGKDTTQARCYLDYIKHHPSDGALLYAVPRPAHWQGWLQEQAAALSMSDFPVGTIEWDAILPHIKNELLDVIDKERRKLDQMFEFVSNLGE